MEDGDYESDFEAGTLTRTSQTKSITLPYSSPHRCFTQSYGGFYSALKTPSSTKSPNPGEKYMKSSFPDLLGQLGNKPKSREEPRRLFSREDSKSSEKEEEPKRLSFGEEIRKRNEHQWLRIEDVVKDTMEKFDVYCKNLVIKNETQHKEIQERNRQQIKYLEEIEKKKKKDNLKRSSYARIWEHHAKMRELGQRLYHERVAKEKARHRGRRQDSPWDLAD